MNAVKRGLQASLAVLIGSVSWVPFMLPASDLPPIQTVFVIVLENCSWSTVAGNSNSPYLNQTLRTTASYCLGYSNVPSLHPSLPNYIWMEAGTNFGIVDDVDPPVAHVNSTNHLVRLLDNAGISWRTYQEGISGTYVPLSNTNGYGVRHNPFAYFDDITGTNDIHYPYGIAHIRPYSELQRDLTNNTVARYNFITPNGCHDGHDPCAPEYDVIKQMDNWLAAEVPKITNSAAFRNRGVLFIAYDESEGPDDRIGFFALSPLVRGGGYWNRVPYTHSSLLRTLQEIFGVGPWLGDAANATDLEDLFCPYSIESVRLLPNGQVQLVASGVIPGKTNLVQASSNLVDWTNISTNSVATNSFVITDTSATNFNARFYRLFQP